MSKETLLSFISVYLYIIYIYIYLTQKYTKIAFYKARLSATRILFYHGTTTASTFQ